MARVEDDPRLAIVALLNRYCHALDMRDWDVLASLFTEDAVLKARMVDRGTPGPEIACVEGRGAILASIRDMWEGIAATHHMVTNHVVDVAPDGRSATGSCYLRAHHAGGGAKAHLFEESLARFDFAVVRAGDAWKVRLWDEAIFIMLGTQEVFGPG